MFLTPAEKAHKTLVYRTLHRHPLHILEMGDALKVSFSN